MGSDDEDEEEVLFFFLHSWWFPLLIHIQVFAGPDELTPLDQNLAQLRKKLEQKYGNDNDETFTFICSDGFKLPLTPQRMLEWAIAIVCIFFNCPESNSQSASA